METHGSTGTPVTYIGPSSTGMMQSNSSIASPASLTLTNPASTVPSLTGGDLADRPRLGERMLTASSMPTISRRIGDLEVSSRAIDACFDL